MLERVNVFSACAAALLLLILTGCNANCFDPQVQDPKQTEDMAAPGVDTVQPGSDTAIDITDTAGDAAGALELVEDQQEPGEDTEPEVAADVVITGCTDPDALNYDPDATEDDGSCLFPVAVTFNLDMSCAASAVAPQVAGGNTFGMPGDNPMSDPEGDEVWTVTIPIASGLATGYTYTSDACGDFSCKEDIAGQDCATEPYNDRFFTMGSEDMTIDACFGVCGDSFCGQCPVGAPPSGNVDDCEEPQVKVEFHLDMADSWDIARNNVIALQGSFDGFWPGIVMERIPVTKHFRVAVCLDPDTDYTYKFASYEFTNGANEFPNGAYPIDATPCPGETTTTECPEGTCTDRVLHTTTEDMVLDMVQWGGCSS